MNIIPDWQETRAGATKLVGAIGILPTIGIVLLVGLLLFYGTAGVVDWWDARKAAQQIAAKEAEAKQWQDVAAQKDAEVQQAIGQAAVYKAQADVLQTKLTELSNARPELQRQTQAATKKVEAIRAAPVRPVDSTVQQRIDQLGADLKRLYPE